MVTMPYFHTLKMCGGEVWESVEGVERGDGVSREVCSKEES